MFGKLQEEIAYKEQKEKELKKSMEELKKKI